MDLVGGKFTSQARPGEASSQSKSSETTNVCGVLFDAEKIEHMSGFPKPGDGRNDIYEADTCERKDCIASMALTWVTRDRAAARYRANPGKLRPKSPAPSAKMQRDRDLESTIKAEEAEDQCIADMLALKAEMDELDLSEDGVSPLGAGSITR